MKQKQWLKDNNYEKTDINRIVVYTYSYKNKVIFVGRGKLKYAFITNSFVKRYPKFKTKIDNIVLSVTNIDITMKEANNIAKLLRIKYKDSILKTNSHSKNAKKVKNRPKQFKEKTIYVFTINGNYIKRCKSIGEVSRQFNVCRSSITKCVRGKLKRIKNYIFSYSKDCVPIIDNTMFKLKPLKQKPLLKVKIR